MQFPKRLSDWINTFFYVAFALITQGWQALGVIAIAVYNDRPWECLFIFVGFAVGRYFFGKSYHAKSMWACTFITWIIFYFMTSAVPSFSVSITLPCVFGISLAYILAYVGDYMEQKG